MNKQILKQLLDLTPEERIDLAQDLWDSIGERDIPPLSDDELAELERRWALHKQNPSRAASWDEARARLWGALSMTRALVIEPEAEAEIEEAAAGTKTINFVLASNSWKRWRPFWKTSNEILSSINWSTARCAVPACGAFLTV
jgi:putative addiction module component (TIGR02574 family)